MGYTYRIEYFDFDQDKKIVSLFGDALDSAKRKARKISNSKDWIVYVVAVKNSEATGHIVYSSGVQIEKDGIIVE